MDLNSIIFPNPEYKVDTFDAFDGEVLYVPKNPNNLACDESSKFSSSLNSSNNHNNSNEFIPCLCLLAKPLKKVSKNFLVIFHGNAEDIFLAREVADMIRERLVISIVLVEYPGYSIYKEEKNSEMVLQDALNVFDFLVNKFKISEENIFIFGRSIGTAPALYLSSKRKPAALVVMSPFTSVRAIAQNMVGNLLKFVVGER